MRRRPVAHFAWLVSLGAVLATSPEDAETHAPAVFTAAADPVLASHADGDGDIALGPEQPLFVALEVTANGDFTGPLGETVAIAPQVTLWLELAGAWTEGSAGELVAGFLEGPGWDVCVLEQEVPAFRAIVPDAPSADLVVQVNISPGEYTLVLDPHAPATFRGTLRLGAEATWTTNANVAVATYGVRISARIVDVGCGEAERGISGDGRGGGRHGRGAGRHERGGDSGGERGDTGGG